MDRIFLKNLIEDAKRVYADIPNMSIVVVTQAIHESNLLGKNGGSKLALNYNNLFGIKSKLNEDGEPIEPSTPPLLTWEMVNGKDIQVRAYFRKYKDHEECFQAHRTLMLKPRYKRVIDSQTPFEAFQALYLCGYATDNRYAKKLNQVYQEVVKREFDEK